MKYFKENIKMLCANNLKYCYFLIFEGVIVGYKKQILITWIKTNIQYSICHISLKKRDNLTKSLKL